MNKREREIESYARERIEACGGWMLKWVSPGQKGVADDIVFWRGQTKDLLEFKQEDEPLSDSQVYVAKRLAFLSVPVVLIDSHKAVDAYIERCYKRGLVTGQPLPKVF